MHIKESNGAKHNLHFRGFSGASNSTAVILILVSVYDIVCFTFADLVLTLGG